MLALSAVDLAAMRSAQETHLPDTVGIWVQSPAVDGTGAPAPTYAQTTLACGIKDNGDGSLALRLPLADAETISGGDRITVIVMGGRVLAEQRVYVIDGPFRFGRTAATATLRPVEPAGS